MRVALGADVGFNLLAAVGVFKVGTDEPLIDHKVCAETDAPRLLCKAESFKAGKAVFLTGHFDPKAGIGVVTHFAQAFTQIRKAIYVLCRLSAEACEGKNRFPGLRIIVGYLT